MKGVGQAIRKKLFLKFVRPFQIINLHNVFHVAQLRKYIQEPSHALKIDNVQIKDNISFKVKPVKIEDHQSTQLRGMTINTVKVVWVDRFGDSSWETKETMRESYPYLFSRKSIFNDKNFPVGKNVRIEKNSLRVQVVQLK